MATPSSKRLKFIDVARTYAIFLALLAHVFSASGFFQQLGSDSLFVKQFTRMATPLFVFMFGFMVEFVYVRKAKSSNMSAIYRRVLVRSFQCYVAYALTSFCSVIGGYRSMEEFWGSLLFFSDSRFGNILRTYSVMLLLVPFIIKLRLKFGSKFILLLLASLILSYFFMGYFQTIDFGSFNRQLNIFFGVGIYKGGPSIYGAMSFMLSGMFIASSLSRERMGDNFLNFYFAGLILIFLILIFGFILTQLSGAPGKVWLIL